MPIKKSELYSSLWKSCDELRGGMDASQYKDYVLVLLFIKYVSDKYAGKDDAVVLVPEGGSFADMIKLKGDKEIGDKINKIIAKLAEANELKGVIDVADFNDSTKLGSGKEMQDRLSNLVAIFENPSLDFSRNRADGDDILGDAYEYLMRHFATESGKSKGQFYTPAEVSRVMAKVIGIDHSQRQDQTIYDPACGSGSLLLKAASESKRGVSIYGQEMDNATAALAKMNMILHDNPTAVIWKGNTLADPHFIDRDGNLKTFDFAVANPPFSNKAWSSGFDPENDLYQRFEDGIPPKKNGDFAFLLHVIRSLKSTGRGAIIMPHGVLFRGNAEAVIRQNIIKKGYIKGIIGLPANLFYGTGIPACIIVLDKQHSADAGIFMIDASKGFVKDGNKNRLRHQDIHKMVDVFTKQLELPKYSRCVPLSEIEKNEYNLNIPRYIDSSEPEDIQDIEAHLLGGIPNRDIDALTNYWKAFPTLKQQLFSPSDRPGYCNLMVEIAQIRSTIFTHHEFQNYNATMKSVFDSWKKDNTPYLQKIEIGSHPSVLIDTISEALLEVFSHDDLIDKYDVYQQLMSYWSSTMQDDVYMLVVDGWKEATRLRSLTGDNGQKSKETADFEVGKLKYKADLIPPKLIIQRFFANEQASIDALETKKGAITQQMEELDEEHGGEDGPLFDAKTDTGKLTKTSVKARMKDIKGDADSADEYALLERYLDLIETESGITRDIRDAQNALDAKAIEKYQQLTEAEVKTLVVDDKWLATMATEIESELSSVSQMLTSYVKQVAERYANPLPQLTKSFAELSEIVTAHLTKMGFKWN